MCVCFEKMIESDLTQKLDAPMSAALEETEMILLDSAVVDKLEQISRKYGLSYSRTIERLIFLQDRKNEYSSTNL